MHRNTHVLSAIKPRGDRAVTCEIAAGRRAYSYLEGILDLARHPPNTPSGRNMDIKTTRPKCAVNCIMNLSISFIAGVSAIKPFCLL